MISCVILTRNEEKNIADCLATVAWCDEIIVIDDNSNDKTAEIAKNKGAKVVVHALNNDFSSQRNYGLSIAKGDYILFVDADERISSALWYEIMAITNDPANEYAGFYMKREDTLWGRKLQYGEAGNIHLLRLAKKEAGVWKNKVHEVWQITGKKLTLQNSLMHFPHQTLREFLQEINYYTDIRAHELFKKKVKIFWWSIILFPKAKFIVNYILKRGFLDGVPGFVFAMMMSLHSFLVRGKLWYLWQKNK